MTQDPRRGRPPAGKREGEQVQHYSRMTVWLPPETRALLTAWSQHTNVAAWRLIDDAVLAAFRALPQGEQRKVRQAIRAGGGD